MRLTDAKNTRVAATPRQPQPQPPTPVTGGRRAARNTGMVKQVKAGYLLRYKKRLFGKAWREEWVVLYEDSTLAWFKEKGRLEPEGSLVVKEAPEMMAVSQWTLRIPGRPDLPSGCHVVQLMAFGTRRRDKVHWLLAQSEEEVNDWMTAISNTLPPPPQPPKPPDDKITQRPLDPVNPRLPPVPYYPSMPGEVPPAYMNTNSHVQFPHNGYARVPMQPVQPPGNTTIVVRDHHGCGAGDFTAGVVMGAALSNWGHGWGWGGGLGGYGFGYGGGIYHDTNVHVSNHYDVNNTVMNNDITANSTTTNNELYVHDDYGDLGFDDGDYGMDCGGDFGF